MGFSIQVVSSTQNFSDLCCLYCCTESISGDTSYEEAISLKSGPSLSNLTDRGLRKNSSSSSTSSDSTLKSANSSTPPPRTFSPDRFAKTVDDFRLSIEAESSSAVAVVEGSRRKSSSSSSSASEANFKTTTRRLRLSSQTSEDSVVVIQPMEEATMTETIFVVDASDVVDATTSYNPPVFRTVAPVYAAEIETVLQPAYETVFEEPTRRRDRPYRYSDSSAGGGGSDMIAVGHSFSQQEQLSRQNSGFQRGHRRSSSSSSSAPSDAYSARGLMVVYAEDETIQEYQGNYRENNVILEQQLSRSSSESSLAHPVQMATRVSISSEASSDNNRADQLRRSSVVSSSSSSPSDTYSSRGLMVVHVEDETRHDGPEQQYSRHSFVQELQLSRSSSESSHSSHIKMASRASVSSEASETPSLNKNPVHQSGEHLLTRTSSVSSYNSESASSQIKMAVRVSDSSDSVSEEASDQPRQRTSSESSGTSQVKMATRVSESSDDDASQGLREASRFSRTRRFSADSSSSSSSSSDATPSRTIAEADLSVSLSQQIFSALGSESAVETDYEGFSRDGYQPSVGSLHKSSAPSAPAPKMNGPIARGHEATSITLATTNGMVGHHRGGTTGPAGLSSFDQSKKVDIIPTSSSDLSSDDDDEESREFRNTIMNFDLAKSLRRSHVGHSEPVIMRNCTRVSEHTESTGSSSGEDRGRQVEEQLSSSSDSDSEREAGGRPKGTAAGGDVRTNQLINGIQLKRNNSSPVPAPIFRQMVSDRHF